MSWHGYLFEEETLPAPSLVAECSEAPRPGFEGVDRADEYLDGPAALKRKVQVLAELIRGAHHRIAYTGAGISTAAGIADYASKASRSHVPAALPTEDKHRWTQLEPTMTHKVLAAMQRDGMLEGWVQQNHDGLPQKAGVPQREINEIHGSWFDPSNPVVPFGGVLREDLFSDLLCKELQCDLCLALGTSLCNTPSTADRLAVTTALRSLAAKEAWMEKTRPQQQQQQPQQPQQPEWRQRQHHCPKQPDHTEHSARHDASVGNEKKSGAAPVGGLVIVSLQRTRLDEFAALRFFALADEVFAALASILHLDLEGTPSTLGHDGEDELETLGLALGLGLDREHIIAHGPHRGTTVKLEKVRPDGHAELVNSDCCTGTTCNRHFLLGRWWASSSCIGRPEWPLLAAPEFCPSTDTPPTLAKLMSLLPAQAAMMLGLPLLPSERKPSNPLHPGAGGSSAEYLEGLWYGHAAVIDSKALATSGLRTSTSSSASSYSSPCSSEGLQPLHLVCAQDPQQPSRLFGAGYTTWPAAAAIGEAGATFFVLLGEVGTEGRIRLRLQWDRDGGTGKEKTASREASQLVGQLTRGDDEQGLRISGIWQRPHHKASGAFVLTKRPLLGRNCAGLWQQVGAANSTLASAMSTTEKPLAWAFSSVGPLLVGAQAVPNADPLLLRGYYCSTGLGPGHIGKLGESSNVAITRHTLMPFRGSSQPSSESVEPWSSSQQHQFRGTLSSVCRGSARLQLQLQLQLEEGFEGQGVPRVTLDFVRRDALETERQGGTASSTAFIQEELRTPLFYYCNFNLKG